MPASYLTENVQGIAVFASHRNDVRMLDVLARSRQHKSYAGALWGLLGITGTLLA